MSNRCSMLMRPNKAETVVHGCQCTGDIAVRMRGVLSISGAVGCDDCSILVLLRIK